MSESGSEFKLTTTTFFHINFYYKSRADFVVRLLLVNGPSSSSDFFQGPSSLVRLLDGPTSPESLHTNTPWVCVIKVCSNGGANYIIGKIIAKDNLNIENLRQTFDHF